MSLNYQLSNIKDWKQVCMTPDPKDPTKEIMSRTTETLIFAMIPVAIGEITEKNHIEFFRRLKMYETVFGAFRQSRNVRDEIIDVPFTYFEVKCHIGLKTNVIDESFASFKKRLLDRFVREQDAAVAAAVKEYNDNNS